jgi:hypothetical protein
MRTIATTDGKHVDVKSIATFMRGEKDDETILIAKDGTPLGRVRGKLSNVLSRVQLERPGSPQWGPKQALKR